MKRFKLNFPNSKMETEYIYLQQQTRADSIKLSFYFLVFMLIIPLIPALIGSYYLDVSIAIATAGILMIIFLWKIIPRDYVQFLAALIVCVFNNFLFLLPSSSFESTSKGLMMLRGYAFASINVVMLSRFSTFIQTFIFLACSYAIRFALMIFLDAESSQVYTIIRHVYIDLFVAYVSFCNEKRNRAIFKCFYDQREELAKFKELIAEYLPHSVVIFHDSTEKPIFSNKAFACTFNKIGTNPEITGNLDPLTLHNSEFFSLVTQGGQKPDLKLLQVSKSSMKEVENVPSNLNSPSNTVYLHEIIDEILQEKSLKYKPVSLSAFYSDGNETKSFQVTLTRMQWDGEDAIITILNDTTLQEKIINLRNSDANKDKIIATVSHELRTPLNGIIGILEMVRKKVHDGETLEYLDLCKDNAHLLLSLVNSLLDLHQVRLGKLRLNPARMCLEKTLREVLGLFIFQCGKKGIFLDLKIKENVPEYIYTDENRLKQILINLIGNALKFTAYGGITVQVCEDPSETEYIQISVSDTGIGIFKDEQTKLFQIYEKLEHGRNVNKNGVGLGLTISNTLAALLNKSKEERVIKVDSIVNQGSTFSFRILKVLDEQGPRREGKPLIGTIGDEAQSADDKESFHIPNELSPKLLDQGLSPSRYDFSKFQSSHSLTNKLNHSAIFMKPIDNRSHSLIESSPIPLEDEIKNNGCILAVDDNPFNLLVAENTIKNVNYSFQAARSGPEAIEILKQATISNRKFKAILMDCQMPIMDGFEATRILKEMMNQGEVQSIPIIALTANNGEEDIKQCYESGMVEHLSKPLFGNELLKVLSKLG